MVGKTAFFSRFSKKPTINLIVGFLLLCAFELNANQELEQLDDLKAVDVAEFSKKLSVLEANLSTLTANELDYFKLLKGYQYSLSSDYKSAKTHLETMLGTVTNEDILIRVKALLVNLQAVTQDYRSAFTYLEDISRTLEHVKSARSREHALSVMAYSYNQLEEFDTAKFYSEILIESALSERAKCHAQYHLLSSYLGAERKQEFIDIVDSSVDFCINLNEFLFANLIRAKKLEYFYQSEMYEEAESYYESYKTEVDKIGYPVLTAGTLSIIAKIKLNLNKFDEALAIAHKALKNLNQSDFTIALQDTLYVLYRVYEYKRDYQNALSYYSDYSEAKQAISDNRFEQQQAYYAVRAEVEVKNQRIALLDKDNELLFLQKSVIEEEAKQTRVLMAVLAIVLIVSVFLAYKGLTGRRRFKKIAEFDQLTGISNRYHFNNQAALALEYCEKNTQPAAVVLFDLDHFKQINDNYGHAIGDWVLQAVVATCRNFMRNNDVFGRIGGEEFAVVLPGCQTDKAVLLAEICRDAIAGIDTTESGKHFSLSASFGVSGSDNSGYQLKQLLADADSAMYRAKAGGRDQVASFVGT